MFAFIARGCAFHWKIEKKRDWKYEKKTSCDDDNIFDFKITAHIVIKTRLYQTLKKLFSVNFEIVGEKIIKRKKICELIELTADECKKHVD